MGNQGKNLNKKRRMNAKRRNMRRKRQRQKRISQIITILAILLIVAFSSGIIFSVMNPSIEKMVRSGVQFMQEKEYDKAYDQFEQVIVEEEKMKDSDQKTRTTEGADVMTEAYRGLGMIDFQQENYDQAYEHLQKVVECGGEESPSLYNLIGISAMKMEEYENALKAFEKGIQFPEQSEYQNEAGEKEKADYSKVIQEMKINRIICFEKLLDWEGAKTAMESYVSEYPEDTSVQKEAEFLSTR